MHSVVDQALNPTGAPHAGPRAQLALKSQGILFEVRELLFPADYRDYSGELSVWGGGARAAVTLAGTQAA